MASLKKLGTSGALHFFSIFFNFKQTRLTVRKKTRFRRVILLFSDRIPPESAAVPWAAIRSVHARYLYEIYVICSRYVALRVASPRKPDKPVCARARSDARGAHGARALASSSGTHITQSAGRRGTVVALCNRFVVARRLRLCRRNSAQQ